LLRAGDQRPEHRIGIAAMPQLETLGNAGALQHLVVDRSLHIKARSSQADLPGVEKDCQRGADRGLVEVGVGKDQRRRLAAQFKGHAFRSRAAV
jgi:hypothetical protein